MEIIHLLLKSVKFSKLIPVIFWSLVFLLFCYLFFLNYAIEAAGELKSRISKK